MTADDASNFANRFFLASANATWACLFLIVGYIDGYSIWLLLAEPNNLWFLQMPGLLIAVWLRPGGHGLPHQLALLWFVCFVLVPISSPAITCMVGAKLNRSVNLPAMRRALVSALKLGFWSFLLTGLTTVATVLVLDQHFSHWSIVYMMARVWLAPLVYLLAFTAVQLISRTENDFVLPEFCSLSEKDSSRSQALRSILSFFAAVMVLFVSFIVTPAYHEPFFRDSAAYVFLFELLFWLLSGLWLVRILNPTFYGVVYVSCFLLPTFYLFNVLPGMFTCVSLH